MNKKKLVKVNKFFMWVSLLSRKFLFLFLSIFLFFLSGSFFSHSFSSSQKPLANQVSAIDESRKLDAFWSKIKVVLKTPTFEYLQDFSISIGEKGSFNLKELFAAAKDDTQYEKKGSELPAPARRALQDLINAKLQPEDVLAVFQKWEKNLDNLWKGLKEELKNPEHTNPSNSLVQIYGKDYDISSLLTAVRTQSAASGSDLGVNAKDELFKLFGVFDSFWKESKKHLRDYSIDGVLLNFSNKGSHNLDELFQIAKSSLPWDSSSVVVRKIWTLFRNNITASDLNNALVSTFVKRADELWNKIKQVLVKDFSSLKNWSGRLRVTENHSIDIDQMFTFIEKGNDIRGALIGRIRAMTLWGLTFPDVLKALKVSQFLQSIENTLVQYLHPWDAIFRIKGKTYDLSSLVCWPDMGDFVPKFRCTREKIRKSWNQLHYLVDNPLISDYSGNLNYWRSLFEFRNQQRLEQLWNFIRQQLVKTFWFSVLKKDKLVLQDKRSQLWEELDFRQLLNFVKTNPSATIVDVLSAPAIQKHLQSLVNAGVSSLEILNALKVNDFWKEIKSYLIKPQFYLPGIKFSFFQKVAPAIDIDELLLVANDPKTYQIADVFSLEKPKFRNKLQTLIDNNVEVSEFLLALEVDLYRKLIQDSLVFLTQTKISSVVIKNKTYFLNYLLADFDVSQSFSDWNIQAREQFIQLFEDEITPLQLEDAFVSDFWKKEINSHFLFWLPLFSISSLEVEKSDLNVERLSIEIAKMFFQKEITIFSSLAKEQLFALLEDDYSDLKEAVKTAIWKQIQSSSKWKQTWGNIGTFLTIKKLLKRVVSLNTKKINHPFFPEGYDISFLQNNPSWEDFSFEKLLSSIRIKLADNNVVFTSQFFPDQPILELPFDKIETVFDQLTLENIESSLRKLIPSQKDQNLINNLQTSDSSTALTIGLATGGSVLFVAGVGGFLYWFFKVRTTAKIQ